VNLDIPHNLLGKELFRTCFSPHNFWWRIQVRERVPVSRLDPKVGVKEIRSFWTVAFVHPSKSSAVVAAHLSCIPTLDVRKTRWQPLRVVVNIIYIGFWVWIPTKDAISIPCTRWGHHGSDIVLVPLDSLQASNVPTSNPLTPEFPSLLLIWDRERGSPWIMSRINTFTWAIHRKWFG
jgi:hypothetical protein